jgi:tRNA(Ile)-lysidine synthase
MLHPFERSVLRQGLALLKPGQRVVVAVSGGADSSALLCALDAASGLLQIDLEVAHLDHGWRSPAEGSAVSDHVRDLAGRLGLPFHSRRLEEGAGRDSGSSGSREAEARRARYAFLREVVETTGAQALALGHTRDDQVETILHRTLRGTSVRGLGGIPARRRLARGSRALVVRPLLDQVRADGEDYLRNRGLGWLEDPSNADSAHTRNHLRNVVLPYLRREVNPLVDDALLRLARQARLSGEATQAAAKALFTQPDRLALEDLRAAEPAIRADALYELANRAAPGRVEARHVRALERIVRLGRGALTLPGKVRLLTQKGQVVTLSPSAQPLDSGEAIPLVLGAETLDPAAGLQFSVRLMSRPTEVRTDPKERVLLDAARVQGQLSVRRRRPGDRFWPLGAPGSRSLKRFLIDQKVPREARDAIPVVTLDDRPVWIVGLRMDDHYKVTSSTAQVLELRASAAAER